MIQSEQPYFKQDGKDCKHRADKETEYAYDRNGNMTQDLNSNISNIAYNSLNLPDKVTFKDESTITNTYAVDGTKLKTVRSIGGAITTTDYCGNAVYENGALKYLLTDEGYVTPADGKYHYYLKDHLGSNRIVAGENGKEEWNYYYPSGLQFVPEFKEYDGVPFDRFISPSIQPYRYNGKERDKDTGWYDYGARNYDPALMRFNTMDRFAEKYYSQSPYQYAANNPIRNIDVNGDSIIVRVEENGEETVYKYESDSEGNYGFYDQNGNLYAGEDEFVNSVTDALGTLVEGKVGKQLVDELIGNKYFVSIKKAGVEGNNTASGGRIVNWDPDKTMGGEDWTGNITRPPYIGLGHELAHVKDIWNGTADYSVWNGNAKNAEKYATHIENMLRSEHKLPLRRYYSNSQTRLIDKYGYSLFYTKKVPMKNGPALTVPFKY